MTDEEFEISADIAQILLDISGIPDPTPTSDGINSLISLYRKDYLGFVISFISVFPLLGDIAKLGKIPHWTEKILRAIAYAKRSSSPGIKLLIKKLRKILKKLPVERLPASARESILKMQDEIDDFLLNDFAQQGHGPQRHEGTVTERQLANRSVFGQDPMTGTTVDGVNGDLHRYAKDSTRIKNKSDFIDAEEIIHSSESFSASPTRTLRDGSQVREVNISLEEALGPDYKNKIEGRTRTISKNAAQEIDPSSADSFKYSKVIDFSEGILTARYIKSPGSSEWQIVTMFPSSKK